MKKNAFLFLSCLLIGMGLKGQQPSEPVDLISGLVAWYPFNGNANDESGNGHHGTANGGTLTQDRLGKPNGAYDFTGENNTLSFSGFQLKDPLFSICSWIKIKDEHTDTVFFSKSSNLKIIVRIVNRRYRAELSFRSQQVILSDETGTFEIDTQQPRYDFVMISYDGLQIRFRINGQDADSSNFDGTALATLFPLTYNNDIVCSIQGVLDEIRIYNRNFSEKEIEYLRNDTYRTSPAVTTDSVTHVGRYTATVRGTIKFDNGKDLFHFGACWGSSSNPDTTNCQLLDYLILNDTTTEVTLTNLLPNTTYYVRMIAMKISGISYYNELNFTTLPEVAYGSVTDVEGNVYKTVQIGNQTWMAENLKTTEYKDGTPIPLVTDDATWGSLTTPAYSWYFNNTDYKDIYGALYNGYAVSTGNLCPAGWHVPSEPDWLQLEYYLGGADIAGGKMKEIGTLHWESPNTGATDEYGFTALPAGERYLEDGLFTGLTGNTFYWSSTITDLSHAWALYLRKDANDVAQSPNFDKNDGHSVRCLMDNQDSIPQVDLQRGLVAWYPFDGNVNDESGNGHHGTANGAIPVPDRFGHPDSACSFNGENNTLSFKGFQLTAPEFTISARVKITDENADTVFISASSAFKILLRIVNHRYQAELSVGDSTFIMQDYSQYDIDPQHPRFDLLNIYYDGSLMYFRVNNQGAIPSFLDGRIPPDLFPVTIKNDIQFIMKGAVDDLRIYNRVLNDKEREALNNDRMITVPVVTTHAITKIGSDFAAYYATVDYDGGSAILDGGVCISTSPGPDTTHCQKFSFWQHYLPSVKITGLLPNTTYYVRTFVINSTGLSYSNELIFKTLPEEIPGSVTDVEGNVYKTIQIESYNWMAENLKTTKYNDGSQIPNVTDDYDWGSLNTGAYCWYKNDEGTYKDVYGALYNYFTVTDCRGICPSNWHIPTPAEWATIPFNEFCPGHSMHCSFKEPGPAHWVSPNGTNETGFTALPGGVRQGLVYQGTEPNGYFTGINYCTFFWQSTGDYFFIQSNDLVAFLEWYYSPSPQDGYSIRCVEDGILTTLATPDQNVMVNSTFEIPVYANKLPRGEIACYQFDLAFDAEKISYQDYSIDNTLSSNGNVEVKLSGNKLTVTWIGYTPVGDSGTLILLKFNAITSGKFTPVLSDLLINSEYMMSFPSRSRPLVSNMINGLITIGPGTGDVDANGNIQAYDASLALQYSVGLNPLPETDPLPWEDWRVTWADVDGQPGISAYDAALMLQYTDGLIHSFPVSGNPESTSMPEADVQVETEGGYIVFRSNGELLGLNIAVEQNFDMLGSPQVIGKDRLFAQNISPSGYNMGLAVENSPAENELILKIPMSGTPVQPVVLNLNINNRFKQVVLGLPTDVPDASGRSVEMYPNPAGSLLYFRNLTGNAKISIYDLQGRKLVSENIAGNQIDISSLENGIYTVRIEDAKSGIIRKFIKQ